MNPNAPQYNLKIAPISHSMTAKENRGSSSASLIAPFSSLFSEVEMLSKHF